MYSKNKNFLYTRSIMLFIFIISISLGCTTAFAESQKQYVTNRLWGLDRYKTAVEISKTGWPNGAYEVVLATGENFPDALCAAPFAKILDAPILLTEGQSLNADTEKELERLGAKSVAIIGGPGVISDNVRVRLEAKGIKNYRIWGNDRYKTALEVLKNIDSRSLGINELVVVTGEDFADALSVSPISAQKKMPILLVPRDYLPEDIRDYIAQKSVKKIYVIGGYDIISDSVASLLPNTERITGSDKYERNTAILNKFAGSINFNKIYLTTGEDYPDALAGSVLAVKSSASIILAGRHDITKQKLYIENTSCSSITILGGTGAISQSIEDAFNKSDNLKVIEFE